MHTIELASAEVAFAERVCTKLLERLQGAVSVGFSVLLTGISDPKTFFPETCRVLDALAVVLRTVSVKPGLAQLSVQRGAEAVEHAAGHFRKEVTALASGAPRLFQAGEVEPTRQAAIHLCEEAEAFLRLLGRELPLASAVKRVVTDVVEAMVRDGPDIRQRFAGNPS
jgi:hypothetical protein